jgi:hypothetical protein
MQCEVPKCSNSLPKNPYVIRIEHGEEYTDFTVCEECARLMAVIEERSAELEKRDEPF